MMLSDDTLERAPSFSVIPFIYFYTRRQFAGNTRLISLSWGVMDLCQDVPDSPSSCFPLLAHFSFEFTSVVGVFVVCERRLCAGDKLGQETGIAVFRSHVWRRYLSSAGDKTVDSPSRM